MDFSGFCNGNISEVVGQQTSLQYVKVMCLFPATLQTAELISLSKKVCFVIFGKAELSMQIYMQYYSSP